MTIAELTETDYWRAIILLGLNTSTYKIALAQCLIDFVKSGKTEVRMDEVARSFLNLYTERLRNNKPQLSLADRQTVMERLVRLRNSGQLTYDEAVASGVRRLGSLARHFGVSTTAMDMRIAELGLRREMR